MIVVFFPQVNELQFSHWVEDVLAVVENLTDGPIVLVKPHRWSLSVGKTSDRRIVLVKPQQCAYGPGKV